MNVLPKMQRLVVLFLFLISLLVVSCGTLEIGIERTATPDVVATNTMAAVATENAHLATQVATLSVTLTPTSPLSGVELPRKLYFLPTDLGSSEGSRGVWLFDPDNARVERITPPDLWITSFDVWPGDGRISYGTRSGQLYIVMPEQEPRLLYDADLQTDDDVWINSVAWSPEGTRLAYSVLYTSYGAGSLGQSDGLWLWVLGNEVPIKLLSNRHLEADHSNINDMRSISDPVWSPDGTALILTGHYWEWVDILWLDPMAPDPAEANLHDPADYSWFWSGSWAKDGQSILLSGAVSDSFSDLVRVRRGSNATEWLIEGRVQGLYVHDAQELSEGVVFLANRNNDQETRLYLGHQSEDGFIYTPVGPNRALCAPGYVRDIVWDPTERLAVLSCSQGVQLVSLDGTVDIDLTPFLGPLAGEDHIGAFWVPNLESN
jgi:hypothetical protein